GPEHSPLGAELTLNRTLACFRPPQSDRVPDSAHEAGRLEIALGQKIGRARRHDLRAHGVVVARDCQDRGLNAGLAQAAYDMDSGFAWQSVIEHDAVEPTARESLG